MCQEHNASSMVILLQHNGIVLFVSETTQLVVSSPLQLFKKCFNKNKNDLTVSIYYSSRIHETAIQAFLHKYLQLV